MDYKSLICKLQYKIYLKTSKIKKPNKTALVKTYIKQ